MIRYHTIPSTPKLRAAMQAGILDAMTGPYQGNVLPPCVWAADNGKFTKDGPRKNWLGVRKWYEWLEGQVARYGADTCRFAVAPDVPLDAEATLRESAPWLAKIRELGIPAAFAAQNGCDLNRLPWDDLDVLFLAGGPERSGDPRSEWKLGPVARRLAQQARDLGKSVHMARVNSRRRMRIAETYGCQSADGTFLAWAPDINLERITRVWLADMDQRPALTSLLTEDWPTTNHRTPCTNGTMA